MLAVAAGPAVADPAAAPAPEAGEPAASPPPETAVHFTVEAASVSSYVWRGSLLSADRAAPSFQPYGELDVDIPKLGNGRLAIGVWTSRNVTGDSSAQEIDPYLWFQLPAGDFLLRAGYIAYILPDLDPEDTSHELSAQVQWSLTPALVPYAGLAVDPIRAKGGYAFAGAAYTRAIGKTTLTATGNVGGSKYEMMPTDLQDVTLSARGSYAIGGSGLYIAATAAAAYSGREQTVYPYAALSVGVSK